MAACAASSPEPPANDPYFPAALTLSPDGKSLFVASANADLKYGSGTVHVYDVAAVAELAAAWQGGAAAPPAGCELGDRPGVVECPSTVAGARAGYVSAAAQIGNFVSALGSQLLDDGRVRLFAAVRGDPSVTWIDWDAAARTIDCGGSGSFPRCDDRHRLDAFLNNPSEGTELAAEPFGVGVDGPGESVLITHLTTGLITLVRAPADGGPPLLTDRLTGIWTPNSNGIITAVSVAPRLPGDPAGFFYVTSRSEARINVVRPLSEGEEAARRLVLVNSFFFAPAPAQGGTDADARGLAFTSDGKRMVMVSRTPASLYTLDTSIDRDGRPANRVIGQVEICAQPSGVAIDEGDRQGVAYVPCFGSGELWAVDLATQRLVATITVGRGPSGVAVDSARHLAFVVDYADDTVTVVDLDPANLTYQHAVLVLGKKRSR